MPDAGLPALVWPFGPFNHLAKRVHELTVRGNDLEALRVADESEAIAAALGDARTVGLVWQGRMYAYIALGRFQEALEAGERLLELNERLGPASSVAKTLADLAEVLIKMGRLDEGLHRLARATVLLEVVSPANLRYFSALSSVCDGARAAELYEFADECAASAAAAFPAKSRHRAAAEMQRAELLLEWGLRLEQIGLAEEAGARFRRSVSLVLYWAQVFEDSPLPVALLVLGLAKTGQGAEAVLLAEALIGALHTAGQRHEARLVHLGYAAALRQRGDLRAAHRELMAGAEMAEQPWQHLIFQHELATLAAEEQPGEATGTMLVALRGQARYLWRLRLERRTMLQQARRRVELEEARARADRAAASDALTGLGNRRQFDRQIETLHGSVVLMLVDVDKFKMINDRYSHGVGDRVLREVASVLRAHCRQDDVPIRFGGDEFALFLRTDLATAARVGERIRQVIAARDWSELGLGLRVTLSIGVAALADGMDGRDLFDHADRQLYAAKRRGRDQLAA
jgi:diguanylate cyclase (GGDEF)-like protein